MTQLRSEELRLALHLVDDLLDVVRVGDVAEILLPALAKMLDADTAFYHQANLVQFEQIDIVWPPEVSPAQFHGYSQLMTEHPFVLHFRASAKTGSPVRIRDLLSTRQWKTSRVYLESHRYLSIDDQMTMVLSGRPHAVRALSVSRRGRPFTDRQCELFALVCRHLASAIDRAHLDPGSYEALRVAPTVEVVRLGVPSPIVSPLDNLVALPSQSLTGRELEVLKLLAQGSTAARIGRVLGIQYATVRKHLDHAYEKLGTHDRLLAVRQAEVAGLLTTDRKAERRN